MMHKKTPDEKILVLNGKDVRFIPIVHFGQKEFYRKLKEKILAYKSSGFTVYYEQTIMRYDKLNISHEEYDTIRRKFRKMTGGQSHSRRDFQMDLGPIYKNMQVQPEYDSLGITLNDINADVSIEQMTNEYERLYGKIMLNLCDINTPLESGYTCEKLHNNMKPIIRNFRNKNLARMLANAPENKILVLYGGNHLRPVKRMLKH